MDTNQYDCPNGCLKYRHSMDEVIKAGQKHKDSLTSLKVIADDQKQKISGLREEKYKLLDEIDQLELNARSDHELFLNKHQENLTLKNRLETLEKELAEKENVNDVEQIKALGDKESSLLRKIADQEDEILTKDMEIYKLTDIIEKSKDKDVKNVDRNTSESSLQNELNFHSNPEANLENKIKELEKELRSANANVKAKMSRRIEQFKRMDALEEQKRHELEQLKEKIQKMKHKTVSKCWFGIKCKRMFCHLDHSHVFRKINKSEEPVNGQNIDQIVLIKYLCDICGKICDDHETYKQHIVSGHVESSLEEQTTLTCKECALVFGNKVQLKEHVNQKHSGDIAECEQCGKYFISRTELDHHKNSVHKGTHEIEEISKNITVQLGNEEHQNKTENERPILKNQFPCVQCNEIFMTKTSLRNHVKRKHKIHIKQPDIQVEKESMQTDRYVPISKLKCNLCELRFFSLDSMDDHMDDEHGGRWKLFDPDVLYLGEDCEELSESEYSSSEEITESEDEEGSESQSGGD